MKKLNIAGTWQFCLDAEKEGVTKGYAAGGFADTIALPGTTSMAQKGEPNPNRDTGYLTDAYAFEGYAWFAKKVELSAEDTGKTIRLFFERTRMTRVWIDGVEVTGEAVTAADSLCTPHIYDLTNYITKEAFVITVLVANTDYPTKGGHMTSPDTQSNWNGIMGRMELQIYDKQILSEIRVDSDVKNNCALISMEWENLACEAANVSLQLVVKEMSLEAGSKDYCVRTAEINLPIGESKQSICLEMGDKYALWSEYQPILYTVDVLGSDGTFYGSTYFGMRELHTDAHCFYVNGQKTFLRGKHDGMTFPLTGAAPMELADWLRVMGTAKRYGINHYRYHTSCPPEAAFLAADYLGIYMQPELPFWGTIAAPGEEGYNEAEQEYLITEGYRIQKAFGNHPSFCMMSLGNELWGSSARLGEILKGYRAVDNRHLFTQGSNNFQFIPCILPEDDFFVGVRFAVGQLIRGSYAMCDAPQGFVQTEKPNTVYSYDDQFLPYLAVGEAGESVAPGEEIEIQYGTGTKKVKATDAGSFAPTKPVVSHEIGQYCTFPNFREIDKYTGVLKARNFEVFKERMEAAGFLELADDYFEASGKLAVACYKLELEAAHRSRFMAGYQILDIQDFNGQGTALVGILDSFMEPKGIVSEEAWRGFCSDAVLMAAFPDFVLKSGEEFKADVCLSCFRPALFNKNPTRVEWRISRENVGLSPVGEMSCDTDRMPTTVACGELNAVISEAGVTEFGQICVPVSEVSIPEKWVLKLKICASDKTTICNSYDLSVFPAKNESQPVLPKDCGCVLASNLTEAMDAAASGSDVIVFTETDKNYIRGFYCTEFWNYPMFRDISDWMKKERPVGTMGLLIQNNHPALQLFPSEKYETPQWYEILTDAHLHILDKTPKALRPIVAMMDNFERNHKLGLLWEAQVNGHKMLVCANRLERLMESAEGQQFVKSMFAYVASADFAPEVELTAEELEQII